MEKKAKTKKMTIDKLAMMVANGFENMATKTDIKELKEEITGVKKEVESVKKDIGSVKNQLEGTNKRIDDFAETKVSKIVLKELNNRVGFIEEKLEIKQ